MPCFQGPGHPENVDSWLGRLACSIFFRGASVSFSVESAEDAGNQWFIKEIWRFEGGDESLRNRGSFINNFIYRSGFTVYLPLISGFTSNNYFYDEAFSEKWLQKFGYLLSLGVVIEHQLHI